MAGNGEVFADRRRWVRQKVHTPAFASFDGVTGGMILDLSEEGLAMQAPAVLEPNRRMQLQISLSDPATRVETDGYVAWADALGRAGVRFSDLPEEARARLRQWLTINAGKPSHKAPKFSVGQTEPTAGELSAGRGRERLAITLEPEPGMAGAEAVALLSTTAQYEFNSLGPDLNGALRRIGERARSLTRGTAAAIALAHQGAILCRASIGPSAPAFGSRLDINSGFSGECVRSGKSLRCDDTETDDRVNRESCRQLGIRSILAAPIQYEREVIGLLEVFSSLPFAFDEGDVAVVERLAQTVLLAMSDVAALGRG